MIKIVQVTQKMGEVILRVQADFPDQTVKTVEINYEEIAERLKKIQELLGREPTEQDFIDAVKAIVNEMRMAKRPLTKTFQLERLINVDLEAGQKT